MKRAVNCFFLSSLFISLLLLGCKEPSGSSDDPTAESLLPKENEVPGWVFETQQLCNEGTANDQQSLFDIIDGGATEYIDRGFVAGAFKGYHDGSYAICVEIYDQGSSTNASSVYQVMEDGLYIPIGSLGSHARLDTSLMFNYEIELAEDKFFVRLSTVDNKTEEYKQAAISIAQNIVSKIGR